MKLHFYILGLTMATVGLSVGSQGFDRYQVILDKHMFGQSRPTPAPRATPSAPVAPAIVNWAKDFRVTMMVRDNKTGEVQVGLQNVKDHSGFLLRSGDAPERTGGYKLERTDFSDKIAIISYQGLQQQFSQESGPTAVAPSSPNTVNIRKPVISTRTTVRRPVVRPTRVIPTPRFTGAELEVHLQEYNEKVIREGLPPLPVPLTPEQDARLVRDGVLPPQ